MQKMQIAGYEYGGQYKTINKVKKTVTMGGLFYFAQGTEKDIFRGSHLGLESPHRIGMI